MLSNGVDSMPAFCSLLNAVLTACRDDDLVTSKGEANGKGKDLSVPIKTFSLWVVIALLCSCATILGPAKIIPLCPPAAMEVRRSGPI
jgi:hypothetical protein